jgi:hypothetical protein
MSALALAPAAGKSIAVFDLACMQSRSIGLVLRPIADVVGRCFAMKFPVVWGIGTEI